MGCSTGPLACVLTPPQGHNGEDQVILCPEVRATLHVSLSLLWVLGQSEMSALLESGTSSQGGQVEAWRTFQDPMGCHRGLQGLGGVIREGRGLVLAQAILGHMAYV